MAEPLFRGVAVALDTLLHGDSDQDLDATVSHAPPQVELGSAGASSPPSATDSRPTSR
jgi:hypothetical protein